MGEAERLAKLRALRLEIENSRLAAENEVLRGALQWDNLRFIQRVLESDAPRTDRDAAAQMVRDMRMAARPGEANDNDYP